GWSHEVIHAAGAHATRIAQALEVIDDRAQERQILRQIGAEIVRMPPKVKDAAFGRGGVDGALDSLQPAVVERSEPARIGPQEAARGNFGQIAGLLRLLNIVSSEIEVMVGQPSGAT